MSLPPDAKKPHHAINPFVTYGVVVGVAPRSEDGLRVRVDVQCGKRRRLSGGDKVADGSRLRRGERSRALRNKVLGEGWGAESNPILILPAFFVAFVFRVSAASRFVDLIEEACDMRLHRHFTKK